MYSAQNKRDLLLLLFHLDFKGIVHPKLNTESSFTQYQNVPNLYQFLNTKEDILKNLSNQSVFVPHLFFHTMGVNEDQQLFGYPHFPKCLCLCSTEKNKLIKVWNNLKVSK